MNTWTPDTVSAEAMFCAMRGSVPAVTMAQCAAILAAIRSGKIPLPEDGPQIAALRARVAELEAGILFMRERLTRPTKETT